VKLLKGGVLLFMILHAAFVPSFLPTANELEGSKFDDKEVIKEKVE
jgi:hypothetical protein